VKCVSIVLSGNMKLPASKQSIFSTILPPPYIEYTGQSGRSGAAGSYMRGYNKNGGTFLNNQGIGSIGNKNTFFISGKEYPIDAITYVQSSSSIYLLMAGNGGYAPNIGWIYITLSGSGGGTVTLNRSDSNYGTNPSSGEAYWQWAGASNPFDVPYGGTYTLRIYTR